MAEEKVSTRPDPAEYPPEDFVARIRVEINRHVATKNKVECVRQVVGLVIQIENAELQLGLDLGVAELQCFVAEASYRLKVLALEILREVLKFGRIHAPGRLLQRRNGNICAHNAIVQLREFLLFFVQHHTQGVHFLAGRTASTPDIELTGSTLLQITSQVPRQKFKLVVLPEKESLVCRDLLNEELVFVVDFLRLESIVDVFFDASYLQRIEAADQPGLQEDPFFRSDSQTISFGEILCEELELLVADLSFLVECGNHLGAVGDYLGLVLKLECIEDERHATITQDR